MGRPRTGRCGTRHEKPRLARERRIREEAVSRDIYRVFTCVCGARHSYLGYVFPYWDAEIRRSCGCGKIYRISGGEVNSSVSNP